MSETINDDDEYFEPYAIYGTRQTFNIGVRVYTVLYHTIMDAANSDQGKAFGMNLLWTLSKMCVYAEKGGILLYNSNDYIKRGVDQVVSIKEWINELTSNKKMESKSNNWIHICRLSDSEQPYSEIYSDLPENITENDCITKFKSAYLSVLNESINYKDTCVIMKQNNLYYVDICNTIDIQLHIDTPIVKSNCVPISIVYNHPEMNEGIDLLFIPNEMYCVNNCIFSEVFVRRCLEYQDKPFVFDERYTINVIDMNVSMYTITKDEYMKILVDGIKICKRQSEILIENENIDNIVAYIESNDTETHIIEDEISINSSNVCIHPLGYSSSDNEQE